MNYTLANKVMNYISTRVAIHNTRHEIKLLAIEINGRVSISNGSFHGALKLSYRDSIEHRFYTLLERVIPKHYMEIGKNLAKYELNKPIELPLSNF